MGQVSTRSCLSTGLPQFDRFLGGGWAVGAVTALCGRRGGGKIALAMRTARETTRLKKEVAVIHCGAALFPPAFALEGVDLHHVLWLSPNSEERGGWAAEQVVRSGLFPLVVLSGVSLKEKQARRLQLSAEKSGSAVLVIQHVVGTPLSWPVILQCEVSWKESRRLFIRVLRSRKMLPSFSLEVSFDENKNSSDTFEIPAEARISS